ncbi:Farnesyl pyrophosphate synthase [Orchesella cincta]|uniref:Farnesyl pyrophosphate synthase n=1 Tax=Orchesella cincta TaxID=48709 RepID=A0A1D2N1T7_ORCCI|nr:Farnesyl pyrophosphate synthase [Orchesella cincta]
MIKSTAVPLTKDELEEFESIYAEIVEAVVKSNASNMEEEEMELVTEWMVKAMDYNIPKGKKLRGLMVPNTYRNLIKNPTKKNMKLAFVLGWCVEILQGASLVADDLVDQSETRRGQPCWYKLEDVGLMAVNDTFMIENLTYKVLKLFFESEPYYMDLVETFREITFKTVFGQCMDCLMGKCNDILGCFTMERYAAIVKYKTSYYTMYLPVLVAMIMAGKGSDKELLQTVEEIMLGIGYYFQVQDDFLDCFGNEAVMGKIGTDIQENKCSWLVVQAVQKCNDRELKCLLDNYGWNDTKKVEVVKRLYKDLELESVFEEYEKNAYIELVEKIKQLPLEIPGELFHMLLLTIYKRRK